MNKRGNVVPLTLAELKNTVGGASGGGGDDPEPGEGGTNVGGVNANSPDSLHCVCCCDCAPPVDPEK